MNVRHVRWGVWLAGLGFLIGCAAAPAVTPVVTGAPRLQVDKESIWVIVKWGKWSVFRLR
jgi:hypothetical protein